MSEEDDTPCRTLSQTSVSTKTLKSLTSIRKKKAEKRPYMIVPTEKRLKLVALIATFGLTCYQAAKIQDIPYTNAKVIYRAYRLEKDPSLRGLGNLLDDSAVDEQTKKYHRKIWQECLVELTEKMNGSFFTERQMARLYQSNFDLFVNNEVRVALDKAGYYWLKNCRVADTPEGGKKVTLPLPDEFFTRSSSSFIDSGSSTDESLDEGKEEKEALHQVLFNPKAICETQGQIYPKKI